MSLTKYQFNKIMRNYDRLQSEAMAVVREREEEIRVKIPEYFELDRRIVDNSMECARAMFTLNTEQAKRRLEALKLDNLRIHRQKENLLCDNGYEVNYLEPKYQCPSCSDTGYVDGQKCRCFKKAAMELVYSQSNIQEAISKENFKTFRLDLYDDERVDSLVNCTSREQMKKNYHTAISFVAEFEKEYKNLLFYGHSGLGKTFLSNCIASELLKDGYTVLYMTAHSLFEAFSKDMRSGEEIESTENTEYILNCDLLIIDDLGVEISSSFTVSKLNLCINERLLNKKSTIISTNYSLPEIERAYGERNFSRIVGNYEPVYFFGDDIRLKK